MKCISFARTVALPILGLIENMSGFVCPCCGEVTNIFSSGGGQQLAERERIHFLGRLPIDTELVAVLDGGVKESLEESSLTEGGPFAMAERYRDCPSSSAIFKGIAKTVRDLVDAEGSRLPGG